MNNAIRQINQTLADATGWKIHEAVFSRITGFGRIALQREDEGGRIRMITLMRSSWDGAVVIRREVGQMRDGAFAPYQDFADSHMLGGGTYAGFPSALRCLATYIDDNRAPMALGTSRGALRLLAGAATRPVAG